MKAFPAIAAALLFAAVGVTDAHAGELAIGPEKVQSFQNNASRAIGQAENSARSRRSAAGDISARAGQPGARGRQPGARSGQPGARAGGESGFQSRLKRDGGQGREMLKRKAFEGRKAVDGGQGRDKVRSGKPGARGGADGKARAGGSEGIPRTRDRGDSQGDDSIRMLPGQGGQEGTERPERPERQRSQSDGSLQSGPMMPALEDV